MRWRGYRVPKPRLGAVTGHGSADLAAGGLSASGSSGIETWHPTGRPAAGRTNASHPDPAAAGSTWTRSPRTRQSPAGVPAGADQQARRSHRSHSGPATRSPSAESSRPACRSPRSANLPRPAAPSGHAAHARPAPTTTVSAHEDEHHHQDEEPTRRQQTPQQCPAPTPSNHFRHATLGT